MNISELRDLEAGIWFQDMSVNEFKFESNKKEQSDEYKPNFELKTKAAISFQPVLKEIYWNIKEKNNLKDIYIEKNQYHQLDSKNQL